jgi:hypothetical protein
VDQVQTRVRWDDAELTQVAVDMVRRMQADASLSLLDAVRAAQTTLPADRQREIKTWAIMEARLQPKLDEARAQAAARAPGKALTSADPAAIEAASTLLEESEVVEDVTSPTLSTTEAGQEPYAVAAEEISGPSAVAPSAPPSPSPVSTVTATAVDPLMTEAALLAALQSPAVEAALVEVFGRAMSKAFARMSAGEPTEDRSAVVSAKEGARVLLAGFPLPQARGLEEALRDVVEVRVWRPNQGPQLFDTLAGICSVAVIPDDVADDVDESLRARNMRVIRHAGSPARLAERLQETLCC